MAICMSRRIRPPPFVPEIKFGIKIIQTGRSASLLKIKALTFVSAFVYTIFNYFSSINTLSFLIFKFNVNFVNTYFDYFKNIKRKAPTQGRGERGV
ncbi:hypothetical protein AB840_03805 [Megasphaera cerevisiae DSM 20462]|uniref:Uncharacterized protein n=1 Tax=Megasphaera cerevisiae DSM 20462 TaxID=1122219 RepID=A0A0J6WX23_9FIRM|nr:hypothetical protein AB840_03805 [Megasphaera cerevisiae DSM 20462]